MSIDIFDGDANLIALAAQIAAGYRPAGGPYRLTIHDGMRHRSCQEYEILIVLEEEDENGWQTLVSEKIKPADWQTRLRNLIN